MKILVLVHAYVGHGRNAGAETTLHDILKDWVARGASVDVVLDRKTSFTKPTAIDGVLVHPYDRGDNFNEMARHTDILMSHLDCSERVGYVAESTGKPHVQLIHNTMWQTEGYLSQGCALAIYNSNWVANHHHCSEKGPMAFLATEEKKDLVNISLMTRKVASWPGVVCHPPIDYSSYAGTASGDAITLINLFENKGADLFYEMARRFPNERFIGVAGGYGKQVLRVLPNVELWENQEDVREVYKQTKILLMPSVYESFGRVALEAAATGIPTVASDTPGLREALGPNGIYCNVTPGEPDSFGTVHPDPTVTDLNDWEDKIYSLLDDAEWVDASRTARKRTDYWVGETAVEMSRLWKALVAVDMKNKFG